MLADTSDIFYTPCKIPTIHSYRFRGLQERIQIIKIPHLRICVLIGIGDLLPNGVLLTLQEAALLRSISVGIAKAPSG